MQQRYGPTASFAGTMEYDCDFFDDSATRHRQDAVHGAGAATAISTA